MEKANMTTWRSDEELMLRYRDGENNALELLYGRYEKPIFDFIYRMVMDAAEAENLCQETFFRVVRSGRKYKANARFKTWLFQIALNLCRDRTRRMKHRTHLSLNTPVQSRDSGNVELQELVPEPDSDPVDDFERGEMAGLVKDAITSLPEDEHLVVVLKEYQGMKFSEIAEITGCPIGTLKSLNHRAHTRLRKSLAKYTGD
jgi:RNA polymerase sigma-70 factor (ECF subfamily)